EGNELAGFGGDINGFQSFRGTLHLGGDFHHHVVLIQAFVDVGNLALAESATQSVADVLNGDAEAGRCVTADHQGSLLAAHLLIGIDVTKLGKPLHALHDDGRPVREVTEIVSLKSVLILRAGESSAHVEVLSGLQVQGGAWDFGGSSANACDV